jgi:hypothetical protein
MEWVFEGIGLGIGFVIGGWLIETFFGRKL